MFYLNGKNEIENVYSNGDILGSRGCPYLCKFCACYAIWGTRVPRFRSVDNILEEVERIMLECGQKSFVFWDDLFAVSKERVMEFCDAIIKRRLNIEWVCLVRLNNIDGEMLDAMKRAGCIQIQVGIESGNDRVLKFIGKSLSVSLINEKVNIIKDSGISWLAFFIVGFPTETKDEIEETLRYIDLIRPSFVCMSIFSPYPGTDLCALLQEKGLMGKSGGFFENDTYSPENNYTGTMTNSEFRDIALNALKFGDMYNKRSNPVPVERMIRFVRRLFLGQVRHE